MTEKATHWDATFIFSGNHLAHRGKAVCCMLTEPHGLADLGQIISNHLEQR